MTSSAEVEARSALETTSNEICLTRWFPRGFVIIDTASRDNGRESTDDLTDLYPNFV